MEAAGTPTCWQLPELEELHRPCCHQRLLRVVQHKTLSVHTGLVVGGIHPHSLLAHGTLICVTRGLVVVWEGDDAGTDTQDHGRVNLAVRVHHLVGLLQTQTDTAKTAHINLRLSCCTCSGGAST